MASRPLPQISTPRLRNFLGARTLFAATVTATVSLQANGIKLMLRRGKAAGLPDGVHLRAHQFRHTLAHTWRMAGGHSTDLMCIMDGDPQRCGIDMARAHLTSGLISVIANFGWEIAFERTRLFSGARNRVDGQVTR